MIELALAVGMKGSHSMVRQAGEIFCNLTIENLRECKLLQLCFRSIFKRGTQRGVGERRRSRGGIYSGFLINTTQRLAKPRMAGTFWLLDTYGRMSDKRI
jgi:hypothetical protein